MNPLLHARLQAWARWCLMGNAVKGLGYSACTLASFMPGGGMGASALTPDLNEDALAIERAMRGLPLVSRGALQAFYLGRGRAVDRASQLGLSVASLYRRVEKAQDQLDDALKRGERRKVSGFMVRDGSVKWIP